MAIGAYRPWGLLPWVIDRCPDVNWDLLGTLSTEERCLTTWRLLSSSRRLGDTYLAEIMDPPSPRYSSRTAQKLSLHRAQFVANGGSESVIKKHELFERYGDTIKWVEDFIIASGPNIIVDISSFPKRYFFPILKILLKETSITNLIVTYTTPKSYPDAEPLAENFEDWRPLPLFAGSVLSQPSEVIVVNVGHLAMGLPEELEQGGPNRKIKLIFPFPDNPKAFHRNSGFVRTIEKNLRPEMVGLKYVNTNDVSDAFDHLLAETAHGKVNTLLAPYGPKPISLAMCLFAINTDSPVYYTQPRTYNPDYTLGMAYTNGIPEIYAYCIRLEGHDYYKL